MATKGNKVPEIWEDGLFDKGGRLDPYISEKQRCTSCNQLFMESGMTACKNGAPDCMNVFCKKCKGKRLDAEGYCRKGACQSAF